MNSSPVPQDLMRTHELAQRYGVTVNTIANWTAHKTMGFPKPFDVLGRKYWRRAEVEAWEANRAPREVGSVRAA